MQLGGRRVGLPIKISEEQVMHEIELDQMEISKIQKQREIIEKIEGVVEKKDRQIVKLKGLLQKYQCGYQESVGLRLQLTEKDSTLRTMKGENEFLRKQFQQLLKECEQMNDRLRQLQRQRQTLIRQRHGIERINRQVQETFKEYCQQCKMRESQLIGQLQQSEEEKQNMEHKIGELKQMKQVSEVQNQQISALRGKITLLQAELTDRQAQLYKNKKMNHQLSVQFDKSVNKIVQFEHELNDYRRDNHELKKTLGLVLEQQKYNKIKSKYVNRCQDEEDLSEQDSSENGMAGESPSLSDIRY